MKVKPDGRNVIARLEPAKRELLDKMLFEQNLSYRAIAQTSVANFGVFLNKDAVTKYYKRARQQQILNRIMEGTKAANAVVKAFTDNPTDTYQAVLKVVGQIAFEKAIDSPEQLDVRTIRELTALLISARREDVQAKQFELEREKWEFDVVRECRQHHADIQAISVDKSLDEDARLMAIRRRLFGPNPPG